MKNIKNLGLWLGIIIFLIIATILYFTFFRTYQVDFDPQGGTWIATVQVVKNKRVVKPQDPIRENYDFVGWFLDDEIYDFNSPVTKNLTFVAHWKEKDK